MKLSKDQNKRLRKLIDEADQAGATQSEICKALSPIFGRSRVEQLLQQVRKDR